MAVSTKSNEAMRYMDLHKKKNIQESKEHEKLYKDCKIYKIKKGDYRVLSNTYPNAVSELGEDPNKLMAKSQNFSLQRRPGERKEKEVTHNPPTT